MPLSRNVPSESGIYWWSVVVAFSSAGSIACTKAPTVFEAEASTPYSFKRYVTLSNPVTESIIGFTLSRVKYELMS